MSDDYLAWSRRARIIDAMVADMRNVCVFDRAFQETRGEIMSHARRDAELRRIATLWAEARD